MAAVAGIAALAVVLVQNVVSDVSEQIAGSNARVVSAQLAGEQVERDAVRPKEDQPPTIDDPDDWVRFYESRCSRLQNTYGDAGVEIAAVFDVGPNLEAETYDYTEDNDHIKEAETSQDIDDDEDGKQRIAKKGKAAGNEVFAFCIVTSVAGMRGNRSPESSQRQQATAGQRDGQSS